MARKKTPSPWEIAKPLLKQLYLDGTVNDAMKPKDVWVMRPEFAAVKYKNFQPNFARMKRTIKEKQKRAEDDEAGFVHDMSIYKLAKDCNGYWDGSEAQRLLKIDIWDKIHEQMSPKDLWRTRPQYQEFDLNKFRSHIHQELRRERETNYWIVRKKKKQKLAEARKTGKRVNEEDMDFLFDPVLNM